MPVYSTTLFSLFRMNKKKVPNKEIFLGSMSNSDAYAIGIDQSYKGFAIVAINKDGSEYKAWHLSTDKIPDPVERLIYIRTWVNTRLDEFHTSKSIVMEGYGYASQVGFMLGELGGMVKMAITDKTGVPPYICSPNQLKKYVAGSGTVAKNTMLMRVYKRWGVEFALDDLADAYGLARIAAGFADTAPERLIVEAVKSSI